MFQFIVRHYVHHKNVTENLLYRLDMQIIISQVFGESPSAVQILILKVCVLKLSYFEKNVFLFQNCMPMLFLYKLMPLIRWEMPPYIVHGELDILQYLTHDDGNK